MYIVYLFHSSCVVFKSFTLALNTGNAVPRRACNIMESQKPSTTLPINSFRSMGRIACFATSQQIKVNSIV